MMILHATLFTFANIKINYTYFRFAAVHTLYSLFTRRRENAERPLEICGAHLFGQTKHALHAVLCSTQQKFTIFLSPTFPTCIDTVMCVCVYVRIANYICASQPSPHTTRANTHVSMHVPLEQQKKRTIIRNKIRTIPTMDTNCGKTKKSRMKNKMNKNKF